MQEKLENIKSSSVYTVWIGETLKTNANVEVEAFQADFEVSCHNRHMVNFMFNSKIFSDKTLCY